MDQHLAANLALATAITLVLIGIPLILILASRLWSSLPQNRPRHTTSSESTTRPLACTTTIFLGSGGHTAEMLQLVSGLDCAHYTPRHYVVGWDDSSSVEKVHRLETLLAAKSVTSTKEKGTRSRSGTGTGTEAGAGTTTNHLISDIKSSCSELAYTVHRIPRSRHVHQSMLTTPFTLVKSLFVAMPLIKRLTCLTKSEAHPNTGAGKAQSTDAAGRPRRSVLLMNGPGTCLALALAVIGTRMAGVPDDQTPDLVFVESFARVKTLSLAGRLLYPLCDAFLVQWPGLVRQYPRSKYIGTLV
ncbi:UDP-N-acetylglucosamine transferase subunit [Mortierella sp. GBA39]|nr:UDP-N-acetylglucosamine transferase subunit [Mortierella sp. GBA39]